MIAKTGIHAIRAMAMLANLPEGKCAGAATVARAIGAPPNYLSKLLQGLARNGLVESRKGPGGGFRLARDARMISLLDVVEPTEQLARFSGCILGQPQCSDETPCAIHRQWAKLRDDFVEMLTTTTLADLIEDKDGA